tara:strand:+ start:2621 stop:2794 length:174 start_codon:yes stop_codon:yes gene_type:complete
LEQKTDFLFLRGDLVWAMPEGKVAIVVDDVPKTHSFADILLDGSRGFIHISRIEKLA